jgi:hypothetical protein
MRNPSIFQAGISRRRVARAMTLLLAPLVVLAWGSLRYAGVLAAVAPGTTVRNGGMEGIYVGGLALGWDDNSWGDVRASFSREDSRPRSGRSCQHIRCESVVHGAAQLRQMGIAVRASQPYTLTLWLRGSVDAPVFVGVRQNEAPYQRYLAQNIRVSPEWQRFVISGTPEEDGPNAGIYVAFGAAGELWVDDVELREGAPEVATIAASLTARVPACGWGNLLYNSSFELGADGWGPVARLKVEPDARAPHGRTVARCTPNWEPILLESRPVVIRRGRRYTISADLKATGPAEVQMVVLEYADDGGDSPGQRDSIRKTFSIDRKWRRVSLSGVLNGPLVDGYVLQLNLRSGSGPIWADALQWEEGGATPYHPAAPVEVAVRAPSRLLSPGQPAVTDLRIYRAPNAPSSGTVTCRLEDGDGRKIAERRVEGSVENSHLTWKLPRPGIYRVIAAGADTPTGRTGQAVFCQFADAPRPGGAPRLGIQGWSNPASTNSAIQAAAHLGAGGFRLHDFRSFVQWYEVEPAPGKYVWHDEGVADLSRRGYRMLGTLCRTPAWATQEGEEPSRRRRWSSDPPRDWTAWDQYVRAVVSRYHGSIQAWEVWNEPWGKNFWSGTPVEYRKLLARTRPVIKAADPKALVVGGCFSPDQPGFTRAVLAAGGLADMDVVSYHDYLEPAKVAEPAEGSMPAFYQAAVDLRAEIRRRNGRQPLWCTESGVPCPSFYSWLPKEGPRYDGRVAVATLVKGLTLALAAGVERVYYYHMGGLEWGQGYPSRILNAGYTLLDYDGSPKPTLPALAQAVYLLGDASAPVELSTPDLRVFTFRRAHAAPGETYVAVLWPRGDTPRSFVPLAGSSVRPRDAMGAPLASPLTLDERPIYLLAATREALVHALAAPP